MNTRPHDWDQDDQQAVDGLGPQLDAIRQRHAADPSVAMLRAARAGALPEDAQAAVTRHLAESPWSRALAEGLEGGGRAPQLDRVTEERIWSRIRRESAAAVPPRRRIAPWAWSGAAAAASILLAIAVYRGPAPAPAPVPAPAPPPASTEPSVTSAPSTLLAFSKPDMKLSAAALTWRGAPAENPFLLNLKPAVDAYRDGDYVQADQRFTELSLQYPRAVEVAFFLGVTRMLRDDFAGAIAPLADALAMGDAAFTADATWYLAVAEQRSGRTAEALRRLDALCAGGSAFKANACAAVQQMRSTEATPRP